VDETVDKTRQILEKLNICRLTQAVLFENSDAMIMVKNLTT